MRNLMYKCICRLDDSQNAINNIAVKSRFILRKTSHIWDNIVITLIKCMVLFCILYCLFYCFANNKIEWMNVWMMELLYILTDR